MITVQEDAIVIRTSYAMKEMVKTLPGRRWHPATKTWRLPATPAAAQKAIEVLGREGADKAVIQLAKHAAAGTKILNADQLEPIPHTKTKPWAHQLRGYHLIKERGSCMLAFDMGTGKSKVIVDAVVNLKLKRTLIVCPLCAVAVWKSEFEKHAAFPVNVASLDRGSTTKRAKQLNLVLARSSSQPIVIVLNYEAIRYLAIKDALFSAQWDMIVADESHRIKAAGGVISRIMARLRSQAERRVCLTGTPMSHSPFDIYSQYRFLDPGVFGTSNARFKNRYGVPDYFGGVKSYRNLDELHRLFYSMAIRVTKAECLDLPEAIHETRTLELPATARTLYETVKATFVAELETGTVTTANALVKLLRLQQITSGHITDDDGIVQKLHTAKQDQLAELLEDISNEEPIVVFCRFVPDIKAVCAVCAAAGRKSYVLRGGQNELHDWQNSQNGSVLVAQIRSGSLSVDCTRACYTIYFSLGFSLGDYEQSLARPHRQGQTRKVTYIHLVCRDTIDEQVYRALQAHRDVVDSVLADMKGEDDDGNPRQLEQDSINGRGDSTCLSASGRTN